MQLYEITDRYKSLFNEFDDSDIEDENVLQAYFDTLEAIEGEFEEKAENIAIFIKTLNAEAEALKREKQKLESRMKAKENKAKWLKSYLLEAMSAVGNKKIETARVKITTRLNAESVKCSDEKSCIDWLMKNDHFDLLSYKLPELSKTEIKDAINSGLKIPYCELVRTQSVVIK